MWDSEEDTRKHRDGPWASTCACICFFRTAKGAPSLGSPPCALSVRGNRCAERGETFWYGDDSMRVGDFEKTRASLDLIVFVCPAGTQHWRSGEAVRQWGTRWENEILKRQGLASTWCLGGRGEGEKDDDDAVVWKRQRLTLTRLLCCWWMRNSVWEGMEEQEGKEEWRMNWESCVYIVVGIGRSCKALLVALRQWRNDRYLCEWMTLFSFIYEGQLSRYIR